MESYNGSCHCGRVSFEFTTDAAIAMGTRCNCSNCEKRGVIVSNRIDSDQLRILTGKGDLETYLFGDKVVEHRFCRHCGIYVFYTGEQCKVNLGCVEGLDTSSLPIEIFDGKHLL